MSVLMRLDFETKSPINLTTRGGYVYAQHPDTDALMASYQFGDGPIERWRPGQPCPPAIVEHVAAGGEILAFNASFERLIWWHVMVPKHGWPKPELRQFRCTAVAAAAMSLPRSLDRLGTALDLPVKKDKRGKELMKIHSIPVGFEPDGTPIWHKLVNDEESLEAYREYCDDDVRTEAAADARLIPLSEEEQEVYALNERVNDRGLRIDVRSARAALELTERAKKEINRELTKLTGGYVTAVTQTDKLKKWIESQGVDMPTMAKDDVDEFLLEIDDLPDNVRRALELRQEGAKPSVEKIAAMLARVSDDGRARGVYLHHGAGQTGRFSSRGVQAHNMPKYRKNFETELEEGRLSISILFDAIRTGDPAVLRLLYGPELGRPLHLLSDAVRSFIWAAPGHEFVCADYTSIEGVMAAYLTGEDWKLQAFEALFRGEGHGIYELAAAGIYGIRVEDVTKKHRPTGKVAELSCLSADTVVLTRHGPKVITVVSVTDELWDGVEWVKHDGLLEKGVRPTVSVGGIRLTADHLVLRKQTWQPAGAIVSNNSMRLQALETGLASLRSSGLIEGLLKEYSPFGCSAVAEPTPTLSRSVTFEEGPQLAALVARRKPAQKPAKSIGATLISFLTTSTAAGFSTASPLASAGAPTQKTQAMPTTAGEVSASIGAMTDGLFSRIWSLLTGGISQIWNSTEKTSTKATRRETSASSQKRRTRPTVGRPPKCRDELWNSKPKTERYEPVYDLLNAGPRNRFTVCSTDGALIVHNCQYQTGVGGIKKFARQSKIKLHTLFGPLWEAADQDQKDFVEKRFEDRVAAHDQNTVDLGREGWMAAELIKVGWRAKHPAIVASWTELQDAAYEAVLNPGSICTALNGKVSYLVRHGFLWCRLPSGRCLAYGRPRIDEVEAPWADKTVEPKKREKTKSVTALGVDPQSEKWVRQPLYGGKYLNNVTQGSARDILVQGLKKAEDAGLPVVLHTHDELCVEVPIGTVDPKAFEKLVSDLPDWAAGMPISADAWSGRRYRK